MPELTPPYPVNESVLPPVWIVKDGAAVMVADGKGVMERLTQDGHKVYPTLASTILYGGVIASAFAHPLKAEPLFDGKAALDQGSVKGLDPVGIAASYRVCATPEGLIHPPAHPSDL